MEDGARLFLPDEILEKVLLFVENMADIASFSMVSKYWHKYIHSNSFWNGQPACSRPILCRLLGSHLCWEYMSNPNYSWKHFRTSHINLTQPILIRSSHGLLCTVTMPDELCIFDPFDPSAPKDFVVLPQDGALHCVHFDFDILSNSYTIILTFVFNTNPWQFRLAIYQSSTSRWSKSKLVEACLGKTHALIGDYVYFVDIVSSCIQKYNLAADSWCKKNVFLDKKVMECSSKLLLEKKGDLLFGEIKDKELRAWIAHEKEEHYDLTLLYSLDDVSKHYPFLETARKQFLGCPQKERAYYFKSETKSLIFGSTHQMSTL